jgi:hypothetical protein
MPGKREPRSSRMLKAPAAMVASVAVQRGLHVGWKLVTGQEPPTAPDDKQVPLGQAVAWSALFGAAVAGARLIVGRYASAWLAPRRQRQGLPEPAPGQADGQDIPVPRAEAPGLPYLIVVAVLAWRRRPRI